MIIKINRDKLYEALKKVNLVVPTNPVNQSCSNFLMKSSDNNSLIFQATDMDISLSVSVEAVVEGEGQVLVSAKDFFTYISNLPGEEITITAEDNKISVSHGDNVMQHPTYSITQFPRIEEVDEGVNLKMDSVLLKNIFYKTAFCVANNNIRPSLIGILWELNSEFLTMVATNTRYFVKYDTPKIKSADDQSLLLAPKALSYLFKIVENTELDIVFNSNNIQFNFEGGFLKARLIDQKYPEYTNIIPPANDKTITVDRQELIRTLKRILIATDEESHRALFVVSENHILIYASNNQTGMNAKEIVPCEFDHENASLAFNAEYLVNIFDHVHTDVVKIVFKDSETPVMIYPDSMPEEGEYFYLIMPSRLIATDEEVQNEEIEESEELEESGNYFDEEIDNGEEF